MFDIHIPLFGWWLVIPTALLICLAVAVYRFGILSVLASVQVVFALIVAVFYAISWDTRYDMLFFKNWPGPGGISHTATAYLGTNYGGIRLELECQEFGPRVLGGRASNSVSAGEYRARRNFARLTRTTSASSNGIVSRRQRDFSSAG